jgi:hypothetical protein
LADARVSLAAGPGSVPMQELPEFVAHLTNVFED